MWNFPLWHCATAQTLQTLEFRLRDVHVCDPVYVYVYAYNPACDQDENLESKTGPGRYWKAGAGLTTPWCLRAVSYRRRVLGRKFSFYKYKSPCTELHHIKPSPSSDFIL